MAEFRVLNEKIGKVTNGNRVIAPQGTVVQADNWETKRDNVYTIPRGRNAYGTGLPAVNISQIMEYKSRAFLHMSDNSIWYDSDGAGTFANVANGISAPDASTLMQDLEFQGNVYFTSSTGIKVLDALGGSISAAGAPKGLDLDARLYSPTSTWLQNNKGVSYRGVWTIKDANNNKVTGPPSSRCDIENTSGVTVAVELRNYIPTGITTDHVFELYRSSIVASGTTASEDYQLCYQAAPASSEITAGVMIIGDILPDGFRGLTLYTNTTQEGLDQANYEPPFATTLDKYRGYVFYGNIYGLHRLYTALIATSSLTAGVSTLKIDNGTASITLGCVAEIASKTVIATANVGGKVEIQTGIAHGMSTGDYVWIYDVTGTTEANGIWAITVTAADKFTLDGSTYVHAWVSGGTVKQYEDVGATPRFIVYSSGTTAQNVANTAISIVKTINLASGNTKWYAYYMSSVNDPPGKFMVTGRSIDKVSFYITANSSATGSCFSPNIPLAPDTSYVSSGDVYKNAVMYSKLNQAEHVPLVNMFFVGNQDDEILKIVALKDSLFFIKAKDGVYRMTGTTPQNFITTEFDGTCKCSQKNSIAKGANAIFMNSNQGYVKVSDTGVELIGRDNEYLDLKAINATGFNTAGYGWFYETEKTYFTSTFENQSSTTNDIVKAFNNYTGGWSDRVYGVITNDTQIAVARVINNICYYAPLTGNGLLKERKALDSTDFYTPDISNSITAIDTTNKILTLNSAVTIYAESKLIQGATTRTITEFIDTTHVKVTSTNNLIAGAVTIKPGIYSVLKYNMCHCGTPEYEKDFQGIVALFDDEETNITNVGVNFYTDLNKTVSDTTYMQQAGGYPWGYIWGKIWGGIRRITDKWLTHFPKTHSKGSHAYVEIVHQAAGEQCGIAGYSVIFDPISTKFQKR